MKRIAAVLVMIMLGALLGGVPATAESPTVTMTAAVNGNDAASSDARQPIRLEPGGTADVEVVVRNDGNQDIEVRRVELAGRVLGLTFFSYSTTVGRTVPPGDTQIMRYQLDLADLQGQATGLITGAITVVDRAGTRFATVPMVTDVRGSLWSVYGFFGLAMAILTALALLDVALALARHRLPLNRFQRGIRFLAPGIGVGLVIAFTASVLRIWVPETGLWLVLAGFSAVIAFGLGYFSPTPGTDDPEDADLDADLDDDLDDDDLDRAATVADRPATTEGAGR